MSPTLLQFTLGGEEFALRAYSTFYALAWVVGPLLAAWSAGRRGLSRTRVLAVYGLALAAGIVGARALDWFVAAQFYAEDPARTFAVSFQGFSLYGGLAAAAVAAVVLAAVLRQPVWQLADAAIPGLAAGELLMRTGCYLNGCCYGLPTELPWGVTYPVGSYAWNAQMTSGTGGLLSGFMGMVHPVHPTQLYEMAGTLVVAGAAVWLMSRQRRSGTYRLADEPRRVAEGVPFLVFAIGFTLVRFGNHFLRARQNVITAPEWFYPALYPALIAVLIVLLVLRLRSRTSAKG